MWYDEVDSLYILLFIMMTVKCSSVHSVAIIVCVNIASNSFG